MSICVACTHFAEELVKLTRGSSGYAFYAARFELGPGSWTAKFNVADYTQLFVNESLADETALSMWEHRWSNR